MYGFFIKGDVLKCVCCITISILLLIRHRQLNRIERLARLVVNLAKNLLKNLLLK